MLPLNHPKHQQYLSPRFLVTEQYSTKSTKSTTQPISSCVIFGSIDPKQSLSALRLLGYERNDVATIALQPPVQQELNGWPSYTIKLNFDCDNFSIRKNENGIPSNSVKENGLGFLEYMIRNQWQVHWLPNQHVGGTGKARLKSLKSLYWEIDDANYSHQWKVIDRLTMVGLEPTLVVHSGGKSLHCYLSIEPLEPTTNNVNRWLTVERLLIAATGGDIAVATVNHSLRLPGFNRHGKKPQQITHVGGNKYSLDQVEKILLGLLPQGMSEDRWHDYRKYGKDVLELPENELPSVIERSHIAPKTPRYQSSVDGNDYFDALTKAVIKINESATIEDFTRLGFTPTKGRSGTCPLHGKTNKGQSAQLSTYNGSLVFGCFKCQEHGLTYTGLAARIETGKPYWEGRLFVERVETLAADFGVILPPKQATGTNVLMEPIEPIEPTVVEPMELEPSTVVEPSTMVEPSTTYIDKFIPPGLVSSIPDTDVTVIAAPMGSGKTSVAAREYREMADSNGAPFLYLSMLTSLSAGASQTIDIMMGEDFIKNPKTRGKHVAACIHSFRESSSLGKELFPALDRALFDSPQPVKPIIFIDEVKATLEGLFCTDNNLTNDRREIIDQLIKYLPFCKVVLADAQVDAFTVELIKKIIQYGSFGEREITSHWIRSTTNVSLDQVYFFPLTNVDLKKNKAGTTLKVLIDQVNKGGMHLLNLTGQQVTSRTGVNSTKVVAKVLASKGIKTLVVDRETILEQGLAADFISNPTGTSHYLKSLGYQVIICSPVIKTGVSIRDIDPKNPVYQGVWTIASGLLNPDMVEQIQYRYRNESIPRYIMVSERGFNFLGNKSTKPELLKYKEQTLSDKLWELYRYHLYNDDDTTITHFLLDAHCAIAAKNNREMLNYRNEVIARISKIAKKVSYELLDDDGFNVLATSSKDITATQKETYKEVLEVEHQAVVDARTIDQKEYLELQKETSLGADDYRSIRKYELIQETGTEQIVPEQVHNQEMGFYNRFRGFYRATKGYELLATLDTQKLSKTRNRDIIRENRTTAKPKADISHAVISMGFGDVLGLQSLTNSTDKVVELINGVDSKGWINRRDMLFEVKDYSPLNQVKEVITTSKQHKKETIQHIKHAKASLKETREEERIIKSIKLEKIQQDYLEQVKVVRNNYKAAVKKINDSMAIDRRKSQKESKIEQLQYRAVIKGINDAMAIEQLKSQKESQIEQLRVQKQSQIAKTKEMAKTVVNSAKTSVIELENEKTSIKEIINQEQVKLTETRKNLTKKYETRQVMVVQGELADLIGEVVVQSPIELVSKIATALGFKLVEIDRDKTGERVYTIMSGYQDLGGNYTTKPDDLHPHLMNHWYRRDMVRIVSRLLNEGQEDKEDVNMDNLDWWLSSGDARLTKFLETITGSGLRKNNSEI